MTQKERIILTDSDGVLVDWINSFLQYMRDQGFVEKPNTEHEYLVARRFGLSVDQGYQHAKEFNQSVGLSKLPAINNSVEVIKKLNEKHGFRFIVVSSVSDHPNAIMFRNVNLRELYGDVFDEIKCLPIASNKFIELQRWRDTGYFWIEDHFEQALGGLQNGLKPILINDATNTHHIMNAFPRVDCWREIYNIICDDYGLEK